MLISGYDRWVEARAKRIASKEIDVRRLRGGSPGMQYRIAGLLKADRPR